MTLSNLYKRTNGTRWTWDDWDSLSSESQSRFELEVRIDGYWRVVMEDTTPIYFLDGLENLPKGIENFAIAECVEDGRCMNYIDSVDYIDGDVSGASESFYVGQAIHNYLSVRGNNG